MESGGDGIYISDATSGELLSTFRGTEGSMGIGFFSGDGKRLGWIQAATGAIHHFDLSAVKNLGPPQTELAAVLARYKLRLIGTRLFDATDETPGTATYALQGGRR